ncbi:MAG TPA: 7-cyano-7-deazaguanine synthase [Blastocatellia bacterium]|nr:7-cyano-7-deazaguanine synthase [Blastocatellia bacterium]
MRGVAKLTNQAPMHIIVPYGLTNVSATLGQERSQRARAFLHLTLGAATALQAGAKEFFVYENGVGAINLPYDETQVGTLNARAVHPVTLARMGKLITKLFGASFRISNPFLFHTKAEMCRDAALNRLGPYIGETFSCDGYPIRVKHKPQCGSCTACVLRRISLQGAGLSAWDAPQGYLRDLVSGPPPKKQRKLRELRAMAWQAYKLKQALDAPDPWRRLARSFPELEDLVTETSWYDGARQADIQQSLLRLYSQYLVEFDNFSALSILEPRSRVA